MMIVRSLLALSFLAPLMLGCSSSDSPSTPAGTNGPSAPDGGSGGTGTGPTGGTDSGTCGTIAAVTGAVVVNASFQNLSDTVAPPVTSGGTLSGRFKATTAKVFLPKETSAFVDVSKTSGTITSWAAFSGERYRLHVEIHLVIATTIGGNQNQDSTVDSEGTFTTSGDALTLTPTCDTKDAGTSNVAYTFTASATAQTIVLKTKVPAFDAYSYTELDSVPE